MKKKFKVIKIKEERLQEIINSLEACVDLKNGDLIKYVEELRNIGKRLDEDFEFSKLIDFFQALGNRFRLKLLEALKINDYCVCELEAIFGKSQPTISHHLRILKKAGLVRGIKRGYFTHYELIRKDIDKLLRKIKEELNL
ncbi:MAG: ArsR/SmtB family transcription factor [Promethearchaeia archaeon]